MATADELTRDIEELKRLLEGARQVRVRALLESEIKRCEQAVSSSTLSGDQQAAELKLPEPTPVLESKTAVVPQKYYKDINTYAWDQSDKFMKIYVSLSNIQGVTKENVSAEFTDCSFRLKIENIDGKNYQCHIGPLWAKIVPGDCYHKLKGSDSILVMLKKVEEKKTWAFVTEREGKEDKKKKDKINTDSKEGDPSAGLMNLLKQMYEDGDDEMKRTIAKSWTESRNKSGGGDMMF